MSLVFDLFERSPIWHQFVTLTSPVQKPESLRVIVGRFLAEFGTLFHKSALQMAANFSPCDRFFRLVVLSLLKPLMVICITLCYLLQQLHHHSHRSHRSLTLYFYSHNFHFYFCILLIFCVQQCGDSEAVTLIRANFLC